MDAQQKYEKNLSEFLNWAKIIFLLFTNPSIMKTIISAEWGQDGDRKTNKKGGSSYLPEPP